MQIGESLKDMTDDQKRAFTAALIRNGWTAEELAQLGNDDMLNQIRRVFRGYAEIKRKDYVDCDAEPLLAPGWRVLHHKQGGQWKFNASELELFLPAAQQAGLVTDSEVKVALRGRRCANANLLDYLLHYPESYPDEWKTDRHGRRLNVMFWGTEYDGLDGFRHGFVRYAHWMKGHLLCSEQPVELLFDFRCPALVFK